MSAVKNLRAMFEQKGEASPPPERGRSPGTPSVTAASESPRPLPKVRTSFIAIEKDGRMGLQREGSQESIPGLRKPNDSSVPTTPITNGKEILNPFEKFEKLSNTPAKTPLRENLKDQPTHESPRADFPPKPTTPPVADAAVPKVETPAPEPEVVKSRASSHVKAPQPVETPKETPKETSKATPKATVGAKEKEKEKEKARPVKPTIITTKVASKPSTGKSVTKAPKSPIACKAPKSPATGLAPSLLAKSTPEKKAQQSAKTMTPKDLSGSSKPALPAQKPPAIHTSPNAGSVKPKSRSPTRPVKLPPSLTTHTAASGLKVHNADPNVRSSSRQSLSGGALPAGKTLKRQNSTISRSRPSLGPPPVKSAEDHPPVKKEKEIDEGFLARMMRPTKASASKVHEKVVTSPPRKPVPAKKTATATTAKPLAKKTAPKSTKTESTASSRSHSSVGRHPIPVIAEPVPIVDEAPEPHKAEEKAAEIHFDPEEQVTNAQEVSPAVEQVETAEDAIKVAKEVEGEVALPEVSQAKDSAQDLADTLNDLSVKPNAEEKAEPVVESATPAVNGHNEETNVTAAA